MRRLISFTLFTVLIVCASITFAFADSNSMTDRIEAETGADVLWISLPEEVRELLESIGVETLDSSSLSDIDTAKFISALIPSVKRSVAHPLKQGCALLCAVLICGLCADITYNSSSLNKIAAAVCGAMLLPFMGGVLQRMTAVIGTASGFMKAYVPVCAGLAAASGAPASAAIYSAFQLGVCSVMETLASEIIIPVTGMLTALCALVSIEDTPATSVTDILLKTLKWGLGGVSVAAGAIFSLQTSLAAASDSFALRGAKFALSGLIPVVGGTLSDAMGTVVSASGVIRSSVGILGVVAIVILLLPTLAELLIWQTVCKILSFFSSCCNAANLEKFFSRFTGAVGILTAVTALTGALFVFATAVLLKTGGQI